jgi:hypothetical protein
LSAARNGASATGSPSRQTPRAEAMLHIS